MKEVAASSADEMQPEEVVLAPRPRTRRPPTKLNAAGRRALLEKHAGFAREWAGRCERKARMFGFDVEELAQAAFLGLVDAAEHYDPARGSFPHYAWGYVKGRIAEWLREERHARGIRYEGEASAEDPGDEDGGGLRPSNAEEIGRLIAYIDGSEALEAAVVACRLDDRDRAILDAARRGQKQAKIAVELGCGLSTVQRRQRSLIEKLRGIVER